MIKKNKKRFFLAICLILQTEKAFCQTTPSAPANQQTSQQVQEALDLSQQALSYAQQIATILFNPAYSGSTQTVKDGTPNPYPTSSLNESAIDATFGSTGINLDANTVQYIKNFYFYLEYSTKLERAACLAALALQSNLTNTAGKPSDFFTLLSDGGWNTVVTALQKEYGSLAIIVQKIKESVKAPAWSSLSGSIQATSWENLITSDFWKSIPITQTDIIESMVWQEYLKYMTTKSFMQDNSLLASIQQAETNIFQFIPDIEVAYYHPDYTHLRYSAELFRINLILTDNLRNRLLADCTDWKEYLDPTSKKTGLQNAYQATQSYAQNSFYSYLATAQAEFGQQDIQIPPLLAKEPLIQERLTILAMAKSILALTEPIYGLNRLDGTMAILNNKSLSQPTPSILLHTAEDYYLLQDKASTIQLITQAASIISQPTNSQGNDPVKTQSFMSTMHPQADNTVVVQSFFGDIWDAIKNAGETIWHAAKALGEGVAALALKTGAVITGTFSESEAQKLNQASNELMEKAKNDFNATYQDAENTITDATKSAEDITDGFGKGLGIIFGAIDPRLGKDVEGEFDAIADTAIESLAGLARVSVAETAGVVRLSTQAVEIASNIILQGLQAAHTGDWKQFAAQLGVDAEDLGKDIATTILNDVTVAVQTFTTDLKNVIKFVAYMISVLTDVFIDIVKGVAFIAALGADAFGANLNPIAAEEKAGTYLEAHRRTINSVIITGLMIATAVATDGASVPAIAMIAGQQVFQIAGSYQQDEMQQERLKEEKQFIDDYRVFVDHNEVIAKEQQTMWSDEMHQKYKAEITNQERTLGFYQNYLNQTFNNYQAQMSEQLGGFLADQLKPDSTSHTVSADLGGIYGFSTGVYEFNPSQGFSLYNKGRNTFSQEIAVFPALEKPNQAASQMVITTIPSKFWFIQQETYPLATATTAVEIRLRAIYVLTTYHIGLYFGGKPYDITSIEQNRTTPVDAGHLAKMVVFRKDDAAKPAYIGVYQHEAQSLDASKNWLYVSSDDNPVFQIGAWYRMKLNMPNATTLQFKVWQENESEPSWQQVTVIEQQDPLTTLGVISSGASIEYQIITPEPTISIVHNAQGKAVRSSPSSIEKIREAEAQLTTQMLSELSIGNINLQIADRIALLKSQFVYTTQNTNLENKDNKAMTDYVLLCQLLNDSSVENGSVGSSFEGLENNKQAGVVSIVSGNVYDQNGKQHATLPNVFDIWMQKNGPLHSALQQAIITAQNDYMALLMEPVSFGSLTLSPTSSVEIQSGQYIYTTKTAQLAKDGAPVKDAKGNQLADYFTFVQENTAQNNILVYNIPYTKLNSAVLSLVSGNVYDNSSPNKVIDSGYSLGDYLSNFEATTPLRADLKTAIAAAQTAYNAQSTKNASGTNNTNQATSNNINTNQGANQGSDGTDTKITPTTTASQSLNTDQQNAGDDQECFGC